MTLLKIKLLSPKFFIPTLLLFTLLVYVIFRLITTPALKIVSILPDNQQPIGPYPVFIVTFAQIPTNQQQEQVTATLFPEINLTSTWNNQTLTLTPTQGLSAGTNYTFRLLLNNQVLQQITYQVKPFAQFTTTEEQQLQIEADYQYAQQQDQIIAEKPWLDLLPISTSEYVAVYDSDQNKIRVRLKITANDQVKQRIITQLNQQNIPTNQLYWVEP